VYNKSSASFSSAEFMQNLFPTKFLGFDVATREIGKLARIFERKTKTNRLICILFLNDLHEK